MRGLLTRGARRARADELARARAGVVSARVAMMDRAGLSIRERDRPGAYERAVTLVAERDAEAGVERRQRSARARAAAEARMAWRERSGCAARALEGFDDEGER